MSITPMKTALLAIITMVAFAANSVFVRLALSTDAIDPASYTAVRLAAGALMLFLLVGLRGGLRRSKPSGTFLGSTGVSALALFVYAAFFSFAYLSVDTGMGALILFACVQSVMIGWGLYIGERPTVPAWIGIILAVAGFIYLVSPGLSAPNPLGALLMAISGIAWGVYSLRGRGLTDPLNTTARNFIWSVPPALILMVVFIAQQDISLPGAFLAVTSGAATSALGYALWYKTLKGLSATKASIIQLTVPLIAAFGGILVLSEPLSLRFIASCVLILGGVAMVTLAKEKTAP